ncbi:MAG: alpha/beta hydrolase [Vicinamibacteria bacterium]|nr:alpha/beta hydrolase [Vicinamibacteria bacterium]
MKTRLSSLTLVALVFSPAFAFAEIAAPQYPPHAIADSQLRALPRTAQGREYQLHVALPASYAKEPGKRYPTLYVTDGYWDFPTIKVNHDNLVYDRVIPELIIVGLGYAGENLDYGSLRQWELSPVPVGDAGEASGHAADFLQTLEQTIIPFIEREYRADPSYRVLAGSSLGGMFTLYTMYSKPALFQGYIASSPAVMLQNDWMFRYEEAFAKTGKPIKARLYITGAENEWPSFLDGIKRFNERIVSRKHEGLVHKFRLIDGERHAGTKSESYVRGMRFVFSPLAPETGPMPDRTF